jgi:hypothetical protein
VLSDEFDRLYASPFEDSARHERIVRALARKRIVVTRTELLRQAGLPTGGSASRALDALIESGFVSTAVPYGKRVNDSMERAWLYRPRRAGERGAQIDLLIDRSDNCITLCEAKFSDSEFVIDGRYAQELRRKRDIFKAVSGTRKTVFIVMITTRGTVENNHYADLVDQQLTVDALFS